MSEKTTRIGLDLEMVTEERVKLWMATHHVACQTDAIHRLLNYALDSAGIVREPKATTAVRPGPEHMSP